MSALSFGALVPRRYTMMFALALCAAALQPALADAQPSLELEVASGAGKAESSSRSANGASYPWAPILTGRAGVDLWDAFTPSIRIFTVAGPAGLDFGINGAGYRAISGLLELRIHSPGDTQLYASAGAGVGRLIGLQQNDSYDARRITGKVGPAFLGLLGVRHLLLSKMAIGGEIAASVWTRGEHGANRGANGPLPPESGLAILGISLLVSVTLIPER
jgi:hypothetical protein